MDLRVYIIVYLPILNGELTPLLSFSDKRIFEDLQLPTGHDYV